MIEPRLSKGAGLAVVDPPEGTGRLPIGKDELPIGRDERGTAVGLVSGWEAAAAGAKLGGWSAVQALGLSDASCAPGIKNFPSLPVSQFSL